METLAENNLSNFWRICCPLVGFSTWKFLFFKLIFYTDNIYKVYKDKLQNCSCNQFHYIDTYKQVETNSMTKNRGGNNVSEKWIEKTLRLLIG
jgi:hypothetical protein